MEVLGGSWWKMGRIECVLVSYFVSGIFLQIGFSFVYLWFIVNLMGF